METVIVTFLLTRSDFVESWATIPESKPYRTIEYKCPCPH